MASHRLVSCKGILFDFDGVLARTMEDTYRAWRKALLDFGAEITGKQFYPLEGMRLQEVAATLCAVHGISADMQEILKKKEAYYLEDHSFSLYPGVEYLVRRLGQRKIPMGIVTAGGIERIQKTLSSDFLGKFTAIITNESGGRGKPYPDPYLTGAEGIGVLPQECIVVENAPLGIRSAKAADMYCIAIASTVAPEALKEADEVVERFDDVLHTAPVQSLFSPAT